MTVLSIRTDQPEAEICIYEDSKGDACIKWEAHRQLGATIHKQLDALYEKAGITSQSLNGIIVYKGPGSFTGLRIGFSVANALSDARGIPIVASAGEDWVLKGLERLASGENEKIALPEYGAPAHTTAPRK